MYAHLDQVNASLGQYVEVGQNIGTIGNTGNSRGSHLHYEVRTGGVGQTINPRAYADSARSGVAVSSSGVSGSSSAADFAANQAQLKDQALSNINSLQQEALRQQQAIQQMYMDLIHSQIAEYSRQRDKVGFEIGKSEYRQSSNPEWFRESREETEKQVGLLAQQEKYQQRILNYIQRERRENKNLTAEQQAQLYDLYRQEEQELFRIREVISQQRMGVIQSQIAEYQRQFEKVGHELGKSEYRRGMHLEDSLPYRQELEKSAELLFQQERYQQRILNYIQKERNGNKDLNREQRTALFDQYKEQEKILLSLRDQRREYDLMLYQSYLTKFAEEMEEVNYQLALLDLHRRSLKDDSKEYLQTYTDENELLKEKLWRNQQEIKHIEEMLKNEKLAADARKLHEDRLKELTIAQKEHTNSIADNNKAIKDSFEKLADDVISEYKKMYQTQQKIALDAIDRELKALEKSHNEKMKMLDEELDSYRKIIDEKIKSIDQEADEEDFQKRLMKLNEERSELQKTINRLSMDDSMEARYRVHQLEQELADKEEEISEFTTQRQRQLRKEALQEELKNKEEEITDKKENAEYSIQIEDEYSGKIIDIKNKTYEEIVELVNEEREAWTRHYENLENDERAFAEIRKEILAGNFGSVLSVFEDFADSLGDHSKLIGESITQNMIDKLNEFNELMGNYSNFDFNYEKESQKSYTPPAKETNQLSEADYKLLAGKFIVDEVKHDVRDVIGKGTMDSLLSRGRSIGAGARNEGSTIDPNKNLSYQDLMATLTDEEKILTAKYIRENVYPNIQTPEIRESIKQLTDELVQSARVNLNDNLWRTGGFSSGLKEYQAFKSGGYTGDDEGLAMLHKKEYVLNDQQTKGFMDVMNTIKKVGSDKLISKLQTMTPKIDLNKHIGKLTGNSNNSSQVRIDMPITIENLNGTKDGGKEFFRTINKGLQGMGVKFT